MKAEDCRDGLTKPITTPSRAIKEKCKDCCCGSIPEVNLCTVTKCPLYNFRKGRYAFKEKKVVSEEQKAASKERMEKMQKARGSKLQGGKK